MKSSFSIFELILTLIISTTIVVYSTIFLKELTLKNQEILNLELWKIELFSTKAFLEKNKDYLSQLTFINNALYFKNSLLLNNIAKFEISTSNNIATIQIELSNSLKQNWNIKL